MKRLVSCLLLLAAVWMSDSGRACAQSDKIVLVGSTPADAVMKSLLGIRRETKVDFVRWNIVLNAPDGLWL